jgi:hypothetical protein
MFPFDGTVLFRDMETQKQLTIEAEILKEEYLRKMKQLINEYKNGCNSSMIDYVQMDTSVPFDYALSAYLSKRSRR